MAIFVFLLVLGFVIFLQPVLFIYWEVYSTAKKRDTKDLTMQQAHPFII